jgi:CHAD domain-containing protein
MMSNGSNNLSLPSSTEKLSQLVFTRMQRNLGRLAKDAAPQNVHHFRTNSRRIEVMVSQFARESRNRKKLLKTLAKLRKKAGKLRDVDVQIAFLKDLKLQDRGNHRAQLLRLLAEERARRSRKLAKAFSSQQVQELRKRLRREQSQLTFEGLDPVRSAITSLPKPGPGPLTEKTLHAFRIAAKASRYIAELAGETATARALVEELKRAQDAIGEWHDVLKLKDKAAKQFGSASDSALVSLLQNLSRARFRTASHAFMNAMAAISRREEPSKIPASAERRVGSAPAEASSAAVA